MFFSSLSVMEIRSETCLYRWNLGEGFTRNLLVRLLGILTICDDDGIWGRNWFTRNLLVSLLGTLTICDKEKVDQDTWAEVHTQSTQ